MSQKSVSLFKISFLISRIIFETYLLLSFGSKTSVFAPIQAESKWQRVTVTLYPDRAYSMPTEEVSVAPIADEWLAG